MSYKSKLQEMCQKQKWALPKYTCVKDGEDHCPLFKASVVVGGLTFDTPAACKSSKLALNEAAQVAFLHFTSGSDIQRSEYVKNTNSEKGVHESSISWEDMPVKGDFQDEFKKKLQMYVHKKSLDLPVYHAEKYGLFFKGRVSIGEDWFQSQGLYKTAEEAEDSAAQAALLSLSTDAFHEDLTDNWGFLFPSYTTISRSDESHCQTFSSTVEVGGEVFQGATAKSKKLAELNAAKAAYTLLMERKLFPTCNFSPGPSDDNILKLSPHLGSVTISDPDQENPKNGSPSNFCSSTKVDSSVDFSTDGTQSYSASPLNPADSSKEKTNEMRSYLLCSRVKVFTCIPNMALPKSTIVLPISEDRWTVFSLEFPNEKGI